MLEIQHDAVTGRHKRLDFFFSSLSCRCSQQQSPCELSHACYCEGKVISEVLPCFKMQVEKKKNLLSPFTPSVLLSFPGKPSFIKTPEDQTGISGGVASFVCRSTGEPKPRITWMKKGKKVSSQRFEVGNRGI